MDARVDANVGLIRSFGIGVVITDNVSCSAD